MTLECIQEIADWKNVIQGVNLAIDKILKGIGALTGVVGAMVMSANGLPIPKPLKDAEAIHYAALPSISCERREPELNR
jgi:hypothetical protein